MEPNKTLVGIVVRKDGTVPFDEGVDPNVRAHILAHLTDNGHSFEPVSGTKHVRIKNWKQGSDVHRVAS